MLNDLQSWTEAFAADTRVPAVSIAVWRDDELHEAAAGILNLDTGVRATTDSIFQIGSITKVMTTCLLMELVESGRVDLDAPLRHYLRDFQIADRQGTSAITVRQLLNHTNGIAGDYFPDDAREEAPHLARFVDRCSQLPLVHPVGEGFSYSNVAFALAGRLVEVVRGMSWYDAMEERLFRPLGMARAICRPAEVIRFRVALGHIPDEQRAGHWRTSSGKYLCLGLAPAGTTPTMTAADLVAFGRAHVRRDDGIEGESWLSEQSIRAMQTPSAGVPGPSGEILTHIGLGWFVYEHRASGRRFVGHGGATNGQLAMLRVFPDSNACFAFLMNCQDTRAYARLVKELTAATGDLSLGAENEKPELPPAETGYLKRFTGHYHAYAGDYRIELDEKGLNASWDDAVDEEPVKHFRLRPVGGDCFEPCEANGEPTGAAPLCFLNGTTKEGLPTQLFSQLRLFHRTG